MKVKRVISLLVLLLFVFSFPISFGAVEFCHNEMGYSNRSNIKLRWIYKENSKYTLPVNNSLPTNHKARNGVFNAIALLNSQSPSNIVVRNASTGQKVEVMSPASSSWNSLVTDGTAIATTIPRSNLGTFYYGYGDLPANSSSTISINYAMIWYNPSQDASIGGQWHNRIAMHEMLHVFGMGHAYGMASLTDATYNYTSTTLTQYDINEFKRMYP